MTGHAATVSHRVAALPARRPVLVLTVALTLALQTVVAAALVGAPASSAGAMTGPLVVRPVARVTAGGTAVVEIDGVGPGGVTLTAIGSAGVVVEHATSGPTVRVTLGASVTAIAGSWTLVAQSDGRLGTGTLTVVSGPAVGPVVGVVGSRSIVADGRDRAMVVSTPTDRFGNAVEDGTGVSVARRKPDGTTSHSTTRVSHLLAWSLLGSGTRAGSGDVWLSVGPVTGPVAALREVAAPPVPFTVTPIDPLTAATTRADAHALVAVRTSVLRDAAGNVEPDGTAVTFTWTAPDGVARADAVTVAGVATLSFAAPGTPGPVAVTAVCRGTAASGPLRMTFASAVATMPVTASRIADGAVSVRVGPVLGPSGAYLPDGAVVRASVVGDVSAAGPATAPLTSGVAVLTLSRVPAGATVAVDVLGSHRTVTVAP